LTTGVVIVEEDVDPKVTAEPEINDMRRKPGIVKSMPYADAIVNRLARAT
jgi:hypothetical protein